jgi:hypothetical protein
MTTAEKMERYEIELEVCKRDFHEDLSRISEKLQNTRLRLSPGRFIGDKPLLISGVGLLAGFVFGNLDRFAD